ncbi:CYCLIC NUCLEOTIDE-GATED ION CHANNEL 15-RELATED-RELATED [Salix koriyanagi]|uniref:CYCLIC NUCLEOTIDE-GATED ION CHANNEL 15-RELATED-RELATED n=1 Tax=Salix koriyanagi TaxID=2511006 RepID=A0A9Q0U478_9ROSI|nr:CYCLIC NUCLEOTIDE-GATED ION CHANNEL 15-RELATED-RELATED [Salix koriyanagi]
MNLKEKKFVRVVEITAILPDSSAFQDWSSEKPLSSEQQYSNENGFYARKTKQIFFSVWDTIRRGWEMVSERIRSLKKPLRFDSRGARRAKEPGPKKKILDPQGPFLQKWNKIIMIVCVLAVAIDPLFFYIPWISSKDKCLDVDKKMQTAACILRTLIDVLYVFRILFQFRTGFIARSSRVFGRGELVEDPKVIAKKYLTSYFIIDILSILPLPQVVVVIILPRVDGPVSLAAKKLFEFVILSQYIPSSFGQNLKTSTFIGEILFAILISIAGLVLFALLIGNMQKYLQSTTVRVEEMRVKRRDTDQWMSQRMLPDNLRERIRRYEQYKWQETRGVEERGLIRNLPKGSQEGYKPPSLLGPDQESANIWQNG